MKVLHFFLLLCVWQVPGDFVVVVALFHFSLNIGAGADMVSIYFDKFIGWHFFFSDYLPYQFMPRCRQRCFMCVSGYPVSVFVSRWTQMLLAKWSISWQGTAWKLTVLHNTGTVWFQYEMPGERTLPISVTNVKFSFVSLHFWKLKAYMYRNT